jgi:carbon storage regulator
MLVIARRLGEKIKIGEEVEITISSIQRGIVRLSIDAPTDVRISRVSKIRKDIEDERKVDE